MLVTIGALIILILVIVVALLLDGGENRNDR